MTRILVGKNILDSENLPERVNEFPRVEIDIGAGDGRFAYKLAQKNPNVFYIAIDPVAENMCEYSAKANLKPSRGGLSNVIYVVASAENLPSSLYSLADKLYITLPWGSLLEGIVKADSLIFQNLSLVCKKDAEFEFCFTYDTLHEASEINKRDLPDLSLHYIKTELSKKYKTNGFSIKDAVDLTQIDLRKYQTTWAKRLGYGRTRKIYSIKGTIDSN